MPRNNTFKICVVLNHQMLINNKKFNCKQNRQKIPNIGYNRNIAMRSMSVVNRKTEETKPTGKKQQ